MLCWWHALRFVMTGSDSIIADENSIHRLE